MKWTSQKCNFDLVNDLEHLEVYNLVPPILHDFLPFSRLIILFWKVTLDYGKNQSCNDALAIVKFLRVTNDDAERGVALLIGEYNKLLV